MSITSISGLRQTASKRVPISEIPNFSETEAARS
jgi:hypothetical protein